MEKDDMGVMEVIMKKYILIQLMVGGLFFGFNFSTNAMQSSTDVAEGTASTSGMDVSINVMWINERLKKDQLYIYPAQDEKSMCKDLLDNVFSWALKNPGCMVNIWFDGELTSEGAVKNTKELIKKRSREYSGVILVALRDIRALPQVIEHPDVFSHEVPVYFRVDLLRSIMAVNMISTGEIFCFIYADLDMEPLSREEIFDFETIEKLQKYGIVMAPGEPYGFENGFQIISNHKANLLKSMKWTVIELNIIRAYNALKGDFYAFDGTKSNGLLKPLEQVVYDSYYGMFEYFYYLEKYGILKIGAYGECYDEEKHGLEPFGLDSSVDKLAFEPTVVNEFFESWEYDIARNIPVPIKQVDLPLSRFNDMSVHYS